MMNVDRASILQRTSGWTFNAKPLRSFEAGYESGTCSSNIDNGDHVAALDLPCAIADADIWKVNSRPHSGLREFQLAPVTLNGANSRFEIVRLDNDFLSASQLPAS